MDDLVHCWDDYSSPSHFARSKGTNFDIPFVARGQTHGHFRERAEGEGRFSSLSFSTQCALVAFEHLLSANQLVLVGLASKNLKGGLDDSSSQAQDQVQGAVLLDVVVRKSASVLELLSGEDKTLLVRRDSYKTRREKKIGRKRGEARLVSRSTSSLFRTPPTHGHAARARDGAQHAREEPAPGRARELREERVQTRHGVP